ncbi:hypothetical protein B0H12DRAFT_1293317 [Mycena haematopus]|nr:hypothetical protein B0H12DRAFT_1293317 [Mycena haematopus]
MPGQAEPVAAKAPDPGPGLFTSLGFGTKSVLRPNPPFVFDSDRRQGRAFLHAVRTYVCQAFTEDGELSEGKAVRYAMSFMGKDAAQRWAERHSSRPEFPFTTWDSFLQEFRLCFVEENEQDHALLKLESPPGITWVAGTSSNLVELAGFNDPIIKVAKYRTGLDPAINLAVTTSAEPPALNDYKEWRTRAFWHYESLLRARNAGAPGRPVPAAHRPQPVLGRPRVLPGLPVPVPPVAPAPPARARAGAPLPPGVPMDIDGTRVPRNPRRGCFRCGDPNHFARDCTVPVDVRATDVLDEVIQQLGGDMLEELMARLASADVAAEHAGNVEAEDETVDTPPIAPVALEPPVAPEVPVAPVLPPVAVISRAGDGNGRTRCRRNRRIQNGIKTGIVKVPEMWSFS